MASHSSSSSSSSAAAAQMMHPLPSAATTAGSGLIRYHSAPSSIFTSLAADQQDYCPAVARNGAPAEFARFFLGSAAHATTRLTPNYSSSSSSSESRLSLPPPPPSCNGGGADPNNNGKDRWSFSSGVVNMSPRYGNNSTVMETEIGSAKRNFYSRAQSTQQHEHVELQGAMRIRTSSRRTADPTEEMKSHASSFEFCVHGQQPPPPHSPHNVVDLIRHGSSSLSSSTNVLLTAGGQAAGMEDSSSLQNASIAATRNVSDHEEEEEEDYEAAFFSSNESLQLLPHQMACAKKICSSCFMGLSTHNSTGLLIRHRSSPAGLLLSESAAPFSTISTLTTSADKSSSLLPVARRCSSLSAADRRRVDGRHADHEQLGLMLGSHGIDDDDHDDDDEWNENSTASEISAAAAAAALMSRRKRGRRSESETNFFEPLPAAAHHHLQPLAVGEVNQVYCARLPPAGHFITQHGDDNFTADAIMCKSRAKRGFATHPRSIAERVRRTKISERVKKLTDLVPTLDKQAHTADMLDEVVEYVKQLKRQVQKLSESVEKCRCHANSKDNVCLHPM